jgi:hypothetical protein
MPDKQIRKALADLHDALGEVDEIDPSLQQLLMQVDSDIHTLLEHEARPHDEVGPLQERVEELGAEFAANHPQTERFFQEIVAILGRLGI